MTDIREKVSKIGFLTYCINERNNHINVLKKENDNDSKAIKDLGTDEEVRQLIINNLHIEDNGKPRKLYNEYKHTTRDGVITTSVSEYDNPAASFNPDLDEFDIVDIEWDYNDSSCRIKVDCIRRRNYTNVFMWEPDYYWTDWIKFNDYDG